MVTKKIKDLKQKELDNICNSNICNSHNCSDCPLNTHDIYCLRGIVMKYRRRRRKFERAVFECIDFEEDLNKEIKVDE